MVPRTRPDAGSMRTTRSVCQTFAKISPLIHSSSFNRSTGRPEPVALHRPPGDEKQEHVSAPRDVDDPLPAARCHGFPVEAQRDHRFQHGGDEKGDGGAARGGPANQITEDEKGGGDDRPADGVHGVLRGLGGGEVENNGAPSVAGQLLITYEWSDWRNGNFWWIQSVYVAEAFRGRGIFRALFEHVRALARAHRDVCGLRLYMDANNGRARQAYERLGLKQTDYQVFELDFVLGKKVTE